jgi:chaperonin GroES
MKIKPLGENVLLRPEKPEEKTESGFVLPESADKPALFGIVEGCGKFVPEEIQVGQKVVYAKYSGSEIGEFILINHKDILGIVNEN